MATATARPAEFSFPAGYSDVNHPGCYFGERPYITVDTCDGVMKNRGGHRMVALVDDFLLGFREAIVNETGPAARQVLWSCGRRFGRLTAKYLDTELSAHYGKPPKEWSLGMFTATMVEYFAWHGWGLVRFDLSTHEAGVIQVEVRNPIMAGISAKSDEPVEDVLAGFLAGMFSHWSGSELGCVQIACVAVGAPTARFLISAPKRLEGVPVLLTQKKPPADIIAAVVAAKG